MRERLCVVGPGFRFLGGVSVYTRSLVAALSGDFDVSVILFRQLLPRRLYPGASRVGDDLTSLDYRGVNNFDGIDWYWGLSIVRAIWFVKRARPDAIVLQWWTAAVGHTYILLLFVARLQRIPVIVEVHEVQDPGEAESRTVSRYGEWILGILLRECSGVLLHHERDKETLIAKGYDLTARLAIAPHGPYEHLTGLTEVQPVELANDPLSLEVARCQNVLFFGLIRPYKGLEDVIEAFGQLPRELAERLVLTVVGETWEGWTEPLLRLEKMRHRDRVRLVNRYVSDDEAAFVFGEADALVLPYRRASSSGPLHIAMAQGLHVILYDVPELRAAVEGYEGAEVVAADDIGALQDALEGVVRRPPRRSTPQGDWKRTVDAYSDLVHGLT